MSLEVALSDLEPLMQRRRIVLIGEPAGTNEYPALVLEMVNRALGSGHEVIVGLEIPMNDEVDKGPVGDFWARGPELQDGKSSRAMAGLVAALASLRKEDQPVQIVALDAPWAAAGAGLPGRYASLVDQPRDQLMADNLVAAIDGTPRAFTVVLAAGVRTSTHAGAWRTFGSILLPWFPVMVSLQGQLTGGTRWVLGPNSPGGEAAEVPKLDLPAGALWGDEPGDDGHHGYVNVGPVTASEPY